MRNIPRSLNIQMNDHNAVLLLGPRKAGKSTYLMKKYPSADRIDLLKTDVRNQYSLHPNVLRERVLSDRPSLLIVDEIQKVPALLDEIHWCLENTPTRFILCGSSARKLKTVSAGILGGRASRYEFFPLTSNELGEIDLHRVINNGLIPQHYLIDRPERLLRSYVVDYLEEEIRQEAIVRDLPAFARFLETAALMNGELLNYETIAREAGVSPKTIKGYYDILVDTLFGFHLNPWEKSQTRRLIQTRKFYLFDCGAIRALKEMREVQLGTFEAGKLFETFLLHEVRAFQSYHERFESLFYWRTSTQLEVDLVIGRTPRVAIEVKCATKLSSKDLSGLRAFREENRPKYSILVYCGNDNRKTEDGIQVMPWQSFCKQLWDGGFQ